VNSKRARSLNADELAGFNRDGFLVLRGLLSEDTRVAMRAVAERDLAALVEPLEFEADTQYPGAPASRQAPGGRTVRRLLQACDRDAVFRNQATAPTVVACLEQMFMQPVVLVQAHHNCVMTKAPAFSSVTGWHRDIRYWSYQRPELISLWFALGEERVENGCLNVLPGSHRVECAAQQLDAAQFLRPEHPDNAALLAQQYAVTLAPGDALFFHSQLFHAAGRNQTTETKLSAVFTYRAQDNLALAATRSATHPEIDLSTTV
jgi:phytanoyl-CoA hydroxylase